MKVTIAVHGRFHGFDLAREMWGRGTLDRLLTTYPAFAVHRFLPAGLPVRTTPWLEALRRLHGRFALGPSPDLFIGKSFARFIAANLPEEPGILVSWSGATLEAMETARRRGFRLVIERGSSHIRHQAEVMDAEAKRFGLPSAGVDPRMIEREEEEYARADLICVPTGFARDTFLARGIAAEKLAINPYGVDLTGFAADERPVRAVPRVLFVGRVGLRKGVPSLLDAGRRLGGTCSVRLVGPVEAGIEALLSLGGAEAAGPKPGAALSGEYSGADIFCLPSLEEGLPLTLLQAMASGLPVVATPETGATDLITHGIEGLIVPSGSPAALAAALAELVADPDRRRVMGDAARRRVKAGFNWFDYGERAMAVYGRLVGCAMERG
jgi:glycosyltransferase involved in cell wall biosynthesis